MVAILVFFSFFVCGLAVSWALFQKESLSVRLWLGMVVGLALSMWLPALFSFALGFTYTAQVLAGATALVIAAAVRFLMLKKSSPLNPAPGPKGVFWWVAPLLALSVYLLFTHTLSPAADGSLHTGQSTYGDMSMHLGFITSISTQGFFPPYYSILPGTPMGYPFLCDSVSSTLYTLGLPLRYAYMLPSVVALFCVFFGAYAFFSRWQKDKRKAALAYALFFIGGGFGVWYFLKGSLENPQNFTRIFTAFYETPTNYVEENIKWVNPIADLLIPQRATLFGWALLFACIYLLYRAAFQEEKSYFLPLGVLAGALPLVHTHSFLALGILSAVLLIFAIKKQGLSWRTLRPWAIYGLTAVALAAPQLILFTFRQSGGSGFLRFGFNWANEGDFYLWFYIKNIGLPYLLILPAFWKADLDSRKLYAGGLAILLICEFIIFQPNAYDNNKLLYIWHLLTCGLVGGFLVDLYDLLKKYKKTRILLASMVLLICTVSGVLTLGREIVSDYELFDENETKLADFIINCTEPDSLVLTSNNHDNAVAALTGRNIVCGSGTFLYYHGLDYQQAEASLKEYFEHPSQTIEGSGIDYVLVGSNELRNFAVDTDWFETNCQLVFSSGKIKLYEVAK